MKKHLAFALSMLAAIAGAQVPTQVDNPGFERGSVGQRPAGWFIPQPVLDAGYDARITSDGPKEGKQCAVVTGGGGNGFGNIMQVLDATPYRGKKMRFRAAVKFEKGGGFGQAQLWMRVDKAGGGQGFFNNMGDRPITSGEWAFYDIVGTIDSDAEYVNIGMMLVGMGRAYIDAVTFGASDGSDPSTAGAKALSPRGLDNLVAYTKLLGYIRHFHPSNAVEQADWSGIAVAGVPIAESAKDANDLAEKLEAFFAPYAPTVRVFPTGKKPASIPGLKAPSGGSVQVVMWENIGFGGGATGGNQSIYRSRRVFVDGANAPDPAATFTADLGGGVSCIVPTALFARDNSALPRTPEPKVEPAKGTGDDRTTRLADIALAWNVFQHFYPYFDVIKTDWNQVLRQSLSAAATDADGKAFHTTLRRLVGAAQDGHGHVVYSRDDNFAHPPIAVEWVEGKLVVTKVGSGVLKPRVGDEILKIDGKKVEEVWKGLSATISGATEGWKRYRGTSEILRGSPEAAIELEVQRGAAESYTVRLQRGSGQVVESLLDPIKEIKPGIWYVDLDNQRANMEAYQKAIPDLAKAKGIVFDLRGYPNDVAMDVIRRLSDKEITSANWNVPKVGKPDHQGMEFIQSRWGMMPPLEPRFKAKVAFITDGRAISYAESIMGIVENYKLGEIVGDTTAGTNGNINPFTLPGGYTIIFTGMKVTKHDGSVHHGVGIKPTVPASRTIAGVIAKKDEVLEKAIQVVGG